MQTTSFSEHRELHAVWSVLTKNKKGYSKHPETLRWNEKLKALYARHELLIKEMVKRGYVENSPLDKKLATGSAKQNTFIHLIKEQKEILRKKKCACVIS